MRTRARLGMLAAGCAVTALLAVTGGGTALADPPPGVAPRVTDLVGAGAGPTSSLYDQLASDYDAQAAGRPRLYSWDAVNPATGEAGDRIVTKAGCPALPRPDGTAAGIAALTRNEPDPAAAGAYCLDYARSYRARDASDPPLAPGGVAFVDLATDAVTYATRDAASGGSDAPPNLSLARLRAIYQCTVTNWKQAGGLAAPIHAFLPAAPSDVRSFFLTVLGAGGTPLVPGSCVSDLGGTLAENEGVNQALNDPDAIVPYSVAAYLAQVYHSAACSVAGCPGNPVCRPDAAQNEFGCDTHGVLGLNEINSSAPVTPWPAPAGPCPQCQINPGFSKPFRHFIYTVVRYDAATSDHIPPALRTVFGHGGWVCTSATAAGDVHEYGFLRDCGMSH